MHAFAAVDLADPLEARKTLLIYLHLSLCPAGLLIKLNTVPLTGGNTRRVL